MDDGEREKRIKKLERIQLSQGVGLLDCFTSDDFQDREFVLLAALFAGTHFLECMHGGNDEIYEDIYDVVIRHTPIGTYFYPEYVSTNLKSSKKIAIAMLETGFKFDVNQYSTKLLEDKDVALIAAANSEDALSTFKYFDNDKDFIMTVVSNYSHMLEFVSNSFKNDKNIVLAAIRNNGYAYKYASKKLKKDKDIIMEALQSNGLALQLVPSKYKKSKIAVLTAVSNIKPLYSYIAELKSKKKENNIDRLVPLEFASSSLQRNRDIVKAAVSISGRSLLYAPSFNNDKEIVMIAIKNDPNSLLFAHETLRNDPELLLATIEKDVLYWDWCGSLKFDKEFILKALKRNGWIYSKLNNEYQKDREIICQALSVSCVLDVVIEKNPELKNDREIIKIAISCGGLQIQYASNELKKDEELAEIAIKQNGLAISYVASKYKENPKFLMWAVKSNGEAINLFSLQDKRNPELGIEAVKQNGYAIQMLSSDLKRNPQIALEAVKQSNGGALQFVSAELYFNIEFAKTVILDLGIENNLHLFPKSIQERARYSNVKSARF